MSGIYAQILSAAKAALSTALSASWTVKLRSKPAFTPQQDVLPTVIVAPCEDLAEEPSQLTFGNRVALAYDVFVGAFVDDRIHDETQLFSRTDVREAIRLLLWEPRALGLGAIGEYDVDYDPKGAGGEKAPPNVRGSWQRFTFKVGTTRATPR